MIASIKLMRKTEEKRLLSMKCNMKMLVNRRLVYYLD